MGYNILKNFWVLEGLDGSGTTTQLRILSEHLRKKGRKVFQTEEPTNTETGLFLRDVLSERVKVPFSSIAYLFAADRDNHLHGKNGIYEHLNKDEIVISDRYLFSSLAYQSLNVPYENVKMLNSLFPLPELVIYISLPPELCIERINSRGEKKEIYERLELQRKIRTSYEKCLKEYEDTCRILKIDGSKTVQEVSLDILNGIEEYIDNNKI